MNGEQYVCLVCGFNMVGFHPAHCPFCGAARDHFISAQDCSERYRVLASPVNAQVTRLNSRPALGYEHAAYRIETGQGVCWIDCPSCFDPSLDAAQSILFTHHHFLGASNLYRQKFDAAVYLHQADAADELSRPFCFDVIFSEGFSRHGIEAFPVDGHTPGFTLYIFEETLFLCDYLFLSGDGMHFNPYGPAEATRAGGRRIAEIVAGRGLSTVCGYNYVIDYDSWWRSFAALIKKGERS